MNNKNLEGCILVDLYLDEWEIEAIERALNSTNLTISKVIVNQPLDPEYDPDAVAESVNSNFGLQTLKLFSEVFRKERFWTLVLAERKLVDVISSTDTLPSRTHVEDVTCFQDSDIQYTNPIIDGNWKELPPQIVEDVGETCDVVIRFGFGLLRGDILTAPELGVLSFHPADIRRYRGLGPPQAYLDGRGSIGITLQRLNEDIDSGEIIAYGETEIVETDTLWDIYQQVNEKQSILLVEGLINLQQESFTPTIPEQLGPYYSTNQRRRFGFASKILVQNFRRRILSLSTDR